MKKKQIIISSILILILVVSIGIVCFYNIPRISYGYDNVSETYFVSNVYGNANSYKIADTVKGKPVTKIASRTFLDKDKVKEIILGENIIEIERYAFAGCKSLESINLENVKSIGRNAFEDCYNLDNIVIKEADILGGAFINCHNLTNVSLINVNSIGSLAFSFTGIEEIIIPASVILVGVDAFFSCENLKKIIVKGSTLINNEYLKSLNIVIYE